MYSICVHCVSLAKSLFCVCVLFPKVAGFSNDQEELDFQFDEELEHQGKQPTICSSDW